MSRRLTRPVAHPGGPVCIYLMCLAFQGWTFASRALRPIRRCRGALAVSSCTLRPSERQGYTNNGQLFGDWIGREDKGGQGWITYHLSGNEWVQIGVRDQKADKGFIYFRAATTLNDINFQAVKRIGRDFEIKGNFAFEHWKAPIYLPGQQTVTTTTIQLTWFPGTEGQLLVLV